jgi:hypothetical protein
MDEREQDRGDRIADEITVGEWLDIDERRPQQPPLVPEPGVRPGLWARLVRALRGTS